MASTDCRSKITYWMGIVLVFIASKASSKNTTDNATTILPSMASPSESMSSSSSFGISNSTSIPNGEFTSGMLPITSLLPLSNFSTMEMSDLGPSEEISTSMMSDLGPSEEISTSMMSDLGPSEEINTTMMISPNTAQIMPTETILQTPSISPADNKSTATDDFADVTTMSMRTTASEYSDLTISAMTSEDTQHSSTQPNIVISHTLYDSSTADMISEAMEMSSEITLSPSMVSHISSALMLSSDQYSSSVGGRGSLLTTEPGQTIDTTDLTTVLQPSRTTEPTMSSSTAVTSNDTADAERIKEELAGLNKKIDDLEDERDGWRIAVAVLAAILGLILLAFIIRCIIKWRQRDQPAKLSAGGVDDLTRKEVLDIKRSKNNTFFRAPGSPNFLDKGLKRISSLFGKRSSGSHELETFGGPRPADAIVMEETNDPEMSRSMADEPSQAKNGEGNGGPKINGDGQENRSSFTEVELH